MFKQGIADRNADIQQLGRKVHRIFHALVFDKILYPIFHAESRFGPFCIERLPKLVLQGCSPGQIDLILSQNSEMSALHFRLIQLR